ncbi:MAG TPA: GNAT family N-acetyltransferase [Gaiellaceae bacterium]
MRTEIQIFPYASGDRAEWDEFIADAPMATFLHSRRYLGHHGHRFAERSLMLRDSRSRLVGVFPAATDPTDERRVVSHPGITYGGVVHRGPLGGAAMVHTIAQIRDHYARQGFRTLRYKAVPDIYHRRPSADDVYALANLGARLYRCDLSCAIDLADRPRPSERRRRGERKALAQGVEVDANSAHLEEFWAVLEENLATRHSARPTHSVGEMQLLLAHFPDSIELVTARADGVVVAGVVLFKTDRVVHAQYIGSTEAGRVAFALDAVFEACVRGAMTAGARFFDFGISTEAEGRVLNAGLHKFKSEFGGGGVVHLFYELDSTSRPDPPGVDQARG